MAKYPKHDHDFSLVVNERADEDGEKVVEETYACRICGKPKP